MSIMLVIFYGIIVLCGVAGFIIELKLKRTTFLTSMLSKTFDFLNMRLAVLTLSYYAIEIFFKNHGIGLLMCSGVFVIISFILTKIQEPSLLEDVYSNTTPYGWEYNAAFAYIDTSHTIAKLTADILNHIYEREKAFHTQMDETVKVLDNAAENLNNYMVLQKKECSQLVKHKKQWESLFNELEHTAGTLKDSFTQFISKLDYSSAAIHYCGESESLLKDITTSFKDAFNQNRVIDEEIMKRIEIMLSVLHTVAYKCAGIQSFPKAYNDAIKIYSVKMETAMKSFEDHTRAKQADITALCDNLSNSVLDEHKELHNTLESTIVYLQKNIFVLTKILETYKNAGLNNCELKKVVQQYKLGGLS